MKKMFLTLLILGGMSVSLYAQNDIKQLQDKIAGLESTNAKLNAKITANQKAISELTLQLNAANENIAAMQQTLALTQKTFEESTTAFDSRIADTEKSTAGQIDHLFRSLMNNTIYWVIAFLVVGFITFYLYRKTRGRLSKEKAAIYNEMKSGNDALKNDIAVLITKSADDLNTIFKGQLQELNETNRKSVTTLQDDYNSKFSKLAEDFEVKIKALKPKPAKAPKAEA